MLSSKDFNKKQIVFVLCKNGEKFQIKNDNLLVSDSNGNIKIQVTCYRLFMINIVGNCSITSNLINKARKFGFYICMYTYGFHLYQILGAPKDGNTILKAAQYSCKSKEIAKLIVKNKIYMQKNVLMSLRDNNIKPFLPTFDEYIDKTESANDLYSLLSLEGLAAKVYFKCIFNNINWKGRRPKIKDDYINSLLDIGYTMLFNFIDGLLACFGFDTYVGVYHTQFYMRKSLTCDIIEPFRPLIDKKIRISINRKQVKDEDFEIINNQYKLKYSKNSNYIALLMEPIIENKDLIFKYIQEYYRAFIKNKDIHYYPFLTIGGVKDGSYKL